MSVFADVYDEMVGKLVAAGLPATRRPDASPPFVRVGPHRSDGGDHAVFRGEVLVRCVVAPPADQAAEDAVLELVQAVLVTLGAAPHDPDTYITVGGKELPAYTVTYPVNFPNPNC